MRITLSVLAALVAQSNATAQQAPGQEPYDNVCLACHGPRGVGGEAPPLVPLAKGADEMLAIIREGSGRMPPISRRELTDEQVLLVVEYLKLLSNKPKPAQPGPVSSRDFFDRSSSFRPVPGAL